ncbi:hypothetical protein KZX46_09045 [Polymorphobacter sp. PAMC 29334]|uniref:hypothetical protein n=1 Tax=Polymorphobacter sp. PAMC 29334 TaxID=2862331 RepID=UPI001C740751|nr:hypothetical protein [Polymorphobacter sp. PAMC 29334]QYE36059.1 hypothetical protein KZX46_09045 [Polymorphobacter sp. PAMC 29334]
MPTLRARHDGWTEARQAVFLAALNNGAGIATAATAAGMSRESASRLRRNPRAADFAARWAEIDSTSTAGRDLTALLNDENYGSARTVGNSRLEIRSTEPRFDSWLVRRLNSMQKTTSKSVNFV